MGLWHWIWVCWFLYGKQHIQPDIWVCKFITYTHMNSWTHFSFALFHKLSWCEDIFHDWNFTRFWFSTEDPVKPSVFYKSRRNLFIALVHAVDLVLAQAFCLNISSIYGKKNSKWSERCCFFTSSYANVILESLLKAAVFYNPKVDSRFASIVPTFHPDSSRAASVSLCSCSLLGLCAFFPSYLIPWFAL